MAIAYTVLMTFMLLGTGKVQEHALYCLTWECVENAISRTHESRALARLRVFEGKPGLMISGNPVFPPLIDYALQ